MSETRRLKMLLEQERTGFATCRLPVEEVLPPATLHYLGIRSLWETVVLSDGGEAVVFPFICANHSKEARLPFVTMVDEGKVWRNRFALM